MKKTNLNKLLCASILSLCTINLLFAQGTQTDITQEVTSYEESAYGETKGYLATKSSTGSKMDIDITEIPQSVSVITKDMMKAKNASTLQQALSYSAAISQPYGENGDTRFNWAKLRGGDAIYSSTFLDGLHLAYDGFAIVKSPLYSLEKVEMLKGPSSVLYGASGPGGLLNLQSKRANDSQKKEITLSYGSNNKKSIETDISHTLSKDVSLRLIAQYKKADYTMDVINDKSYFINPSLKYHIGDNTTLDILTSFSKDKMVGAGIGSGTEQVLTIGDSIKKNSAYLSAAIGGARTPLQIRNAADTLNNLNLPSTLYFGNQSDHLERTYSSISTLLKHTINDSLEFNSNFRVSKLDGEYQYSGFKNTQAIFGAYIASLDYSKITLEQEKVKMSLDAIALDNNLQYNWNTKNIENTSIFGLDIKYQESEEKKYDALAYSFDSVNPNYSYNIGNHTSVSNQAKEDLTQIGFYVQNQAKINKKFIISTALRYDTVKKEVDDLLDNTNDSVQKDNNTSGRLGFAYIFDNGITPYVSYSTSFVTNPGKNKSGKSHIPSIGKQFEIGAKYKVDKINALFTISAYKLEETNILTADPSDTNFSVQESSSDIKGYEFDATFKPIENMNIIASFAKISAKEKNTTDAVNEGRDLAGVSDSNISLWSDYTFKNTKIGDLKLGAGIKYIGSNVKYVEDAFAQNSPEEGIDINSYTLVDTLITTKYKNIDFSFNISNLFDKEVYINPTSTGYSLTQGRMYNFSVKYTF